MPPIVLGERVVVSQRAHLCTGSHDYTSPTFPLFAKTIRVGRDAWICTEAFIGPGVQIGEGAVIGTRAVAMRDQPPLDGVRWQSSPCSQTAHSSLRQSFSIRCKHRQSRLKATHSKPQVPPSNSNIDGGLKHERFHSSRTC